MDENQIEKITKNELKQFTKKRNKADGNCLFYSVSQILYGDDTYHKEIRKEVCKFYKTFKQNSPKNDVETAIAMSMIGDPTDNDGKIHKETVCDNLKYANVTDIMIIGYIYHANINLYIPINNDLYAINTYKIHEPIMTMNILFNGRDHYEALLPAGSKSKSPSNRGKQTKSTKESQRSEKGRTEKHRSTSKSISLESTENSKRMLANIIKCIDQQDRDILAAPESEQIALIQLLSKVRNYVEKQM